MSTQKGTAKGWLMVLLAWAWQILSYNPLMWPVIWFFRFWFWIFGSLGRAYGGAHAAYETAKSEKTLPTEGSLPPFVLLAWLFLKVGEWVTWVWTFFWSSEPNMRYTSYPREGKRMEKEVSFQSNETFHTPPSSPPPFDVVGEEVAGEDDESEASKGVPARTLRERLRYLGNAISALRRLGGPSMLYEGGGRSYSQLPKAQQPNFRLGMNRSMRAYNLFEEIKQDYVKVMETLPDDESQKEKIMATVHERSAKKVLELARTNGGLYTKAAQFVASLQGGAGDKGIPKPYVEVLRVLTDSAPYHEFEEMDTVFFEEFGKSAKDTFERFDEMPIAAASLAQVHRATLPGGKEVAVKIIYPNLRKEMASDFAMFRRLGSQIKPGGYDMGWLVDDFEEAISSELDCEHEAGNLEISANLLAGRKGVFLPKVYWDLTRRDILVMEFMPGLMRTTDPEVLLANGLNLNECGSIVSDTLTELALVHGHVHGDPHAGNIYVVAQRGGILNRGMKPGVVILDHGLYYSIDEMVRRDLCFLFIACINRNRKEIARLSERLAGPLHRFLPLLLSPWFIVGTSLSAEDINAARQNKLPPSVSSKDVGDAMNSLHTLEGNILAVLHSFGYVRGLLNSLKFGERRRLKSIARYAVLGVAPRDLAARALQKGDRTLPLRWRLKLLKANLNCDVIAAMLQVLSVVTSSELDISKSGIIFSTLANISLEIGRWSLLRQIVNMVIMRTRQAEVNEGATVSEELDRARNFGSSNSVAGESVLSRAESEDFYLRQEMSRPPTNSSDSIYTEPDQSSERPVRGSRFGVATLVSDSGSSVARLVSRTWKRVRTYGDVEKEPKVRARRLRHYSPTRAAPNRPWV